MLRLLLTGRMRLVAANADLIRAEIDDRADLAARLRVDLPAGWPPDVMLSEALPWFREQLEADPDKAGWLNWYGIVTGEPDVLVASGGFLGPPTGGGVEIGYSVLPSYRGKGYATEMMRALVDLALRMPGVDRVVADVHPENIPSVRLLLRLGFSAVGPSADHGFVRYVRTREG